MDRKPMELAEHSCGVIISARLEDNTCKGILNSLKFEHSSLRREQYRIEFVQSIRELTRECHISAAIGGTSGWK